MRTASTGCFGFESSLSLHRRELLRLGALGLGNLGLGDLLASAATTSRRAPARACILMFMWGGPSQLDTWDMKPNAPDDIRGEFKPIATSVPGLQISEHLPRLARLAHHYTIVRSMTHDDPAHLSSVHHLMTGRYAPRPKSDAVGASRKDMPHIGSVLARLKPTGSALPAFVQMPWLVSHPAAPGGQAPGQNAGWLGTSFDPFVIPGDPNAPGFAIPGMDPGPELSVHRLEDRAHLLAQMRRQETGLADATTWQQQAFDLLRSAVGRRAFELSLEPDRVRDRYGRNIHGQSLLLARRLLEAGVRLICVNWHQDQQNFWDTHGNNFNSLKTRLMPPADQGFSALLEDLHNRGQLDETLLVWVGEFGRTPRINKANAGREHWPQCYSAVLAGGGIARGQVYGQSDRIAAYPTDKPVSPADLTATIYHALGIDPEMMLRDREGRPIRLTEGDPLRGLFA